MKNNEDLNNHVNTNNNVNQQVQNNKVLIILMTLIIVGLAGYIVNTKFIQKSDNIDSTQNNTQENCNCPKCQECESGISQCNCSNLSTSYLGEKITNLEKINLTASNQTVKIGKKNLKIKKDSQGVMYVNDQKIYADGSDLSPSNVYMTDKFLFVTVNGQFYEGIWYAISEQGEVGINNNEYTMYNFKIVDGYLHAHGGKIYDNGLDLSVEDKDLLIKFIDNTLIVTYAK